MYIRFQPLYPECRFAW